MELYKSKGGYFYKIVKNRKIRISRDNYLRLKKCEKVGRKVSGKKHVGGTLPRNILDKDVEGCIKLNEDDYTLGKRLQSQGRVGTAYEAIYNKTDEKKVIKKISQLYILQLKRLYDEFIYEIKTGIEAQECPYLLHIDGYYLDNDNGYIVMEYCEGDNITDYRRNLGRLPTEEEVRNFALQLAHGLNFLHSKNIGHYDIKPDNIMISPRGNIKIIDYGFVHRSNNQEIRVFKGTPFYTSPNLINETLSEKSIQLETDIWAYGAILYFFITGKILASNNGKIKNIGRLKQFITSNAYNELIKKDCSDYINICALILMCSEKKPQNRPNMETIIDILVNIDNKVNIDNEGINKWFHFKSGNNSRYVKYKYKEKNGIVNKNSKILNVISNPPTNLNSSIEEKEITNEKWKLFLNELTTLGY